MSVTMHELDLAARAPRDVYRLLIGLVVPRPIAWVTTRDAEGRPNAAPFSFFNVMAEDPPLVVMGLDGRLGERTPKDTTANIQATGEFVVHIVDRAHAEAMNRTAIDHPPEVDELADAGLRTVPATKVDVPRIDGVPAVLECRRYQALEIGPRRVIMIGEVVHIAVRADVIDPTTERIDARALDAVARLGGADYATIRDRFTMPRLTA